jgi:hypothetical protein
MREGVAELRLSGFSKHCKESEADISAVPRPTALFERPDRQADTLEFETREGFTSGEDDGFDFDKTHRWKFGFPGAVIHATTGALP